MVEISTSLGFILGLVLGSLVYCIALRSVTKQSFWGRSYCESCQKELVWYDLFPILSYLSTKGKCRYCAKKISREYPLVELLTGLLLTLVVFYNFTPQLLNESYWVISLWALELLFKIFIVSILVAVFVTDIKTGLIPDRITYPSILIALILLIFTASYQVFLLYQSLTASPIGKYLLPPSSDYFQRHVLMIFETLGISVLTAFAIGLFFFVLILITKGRGMGGGDMKLGVFMGLSLGFPGALTALMLAFLSGSIFGIALLLTGKRKLGQTIPFGPFLALGGILTVLWGQKILAFYLNFKL